LSSLGKSFIVIKPFFKYFTFSAVFPELVSIDRSLIDIGDESAGEWIKGEIQSKG
jgi:hypothetical protein